MAGIGIRHDDVGTELTQTEYEEDASHEIYADVDFSGYGYKDINLILENHTADDTLTKAESGSIHTNFGASADITFTLPQDATKGCLFKFLVLAEYELRIDPGAAGAMYVDGVKQTDDKYIYSSTLGDIVEVFCDGNNDWFITLVNGTWSVET